MQAKNSYTHWQEEEKDMLIALVKEYKKQFNNMRWQQIAESFKHRTAQQCRVFYNHLMRQVAMNEQQLIESQWTAAQLIKLVIASIVFQNDYKFIAKNVLKQYSVETIKEMHTQYSNHSKFIQQLIKKKELPVFFFEKDIVAHNFEKQFKQKYTKEIQMYESKECQMQHNLLIQLESLLVNL